MSTCLSRSARDKRKENRNQKAAGYAGMVVLHSITWGFVRSNSVSSPIYVYVRVLISKLNL
jgi:hypothetical protein